MVACARDACARMPIAARSSASATRIAFPRDGERQIRRASIARAAAMVAMIRGPEMGLRCLCTQTRERSHHRVLRALQMLRTRSIDDHIDGRVRAARPRISLSFCLLYTSDAADERSSVD